MVSVFPQEIAKQTKVIVSLQVVSAQPVMAMSSVTLMDTGLRARKVIHAMVKVLMEEIVSPTQAITLVVKLPNAKKLRLTTQIG